ncbi:MAG TPA: dienelactone hydrolase family protein [Frankiaceae bacterium]|jgi:carboxymethylenebutenolidase|nr:dienelactone hydrolase family protein [Frankiaceae bacterium]
MTELQAGPPSATYDNVTRERISLTGRDGVAFDALSFQPDGAGPFPAIVIGAEGTGVNRFIERVGAGLAHEGVVAVVIDPYRFDGPPDPEDYTDFDALMAYINDLDFVRATHDMLAGVEHARALPTVDPDRVGVWGYCTGATLALLAACIDQRLGAAILFYPSQPVFDQLGDRTPAHPMDLLWGLGARTLLLYGDDDVVMPAERLAELRRRLAVWHVSHELALYPGAGHAFCSEARPLFHSQAAEDGWHRGVAFALDALG